MDQSKNTLLLFTRDAANQSQECCSIDNALLESINQLWHWTNSPANLKAATRLGAAQFFFSLSMFDDCRYWGGLWIKLRLSCRMWLPPFHQIKCLHITFPVITGITNIHSGELHTCMPHLMCGITCHCPLNEPALSWMYLWSNMVIWALSPSMWGLGSKGSAACYVHLDMIHVCLSRNIARTTWYHCIFSPRR